VHRGASATLNNPGFETVFMQDGRNATLEEQALGAVNAHYEPGVQPTDAELEAIADFEQFGLINYSSIDLWIRGIFQIDPELPDGTTPEEIRGRAWFDNDSPTGFCAHCHGGPFLNEINQFFVGPPLPVGSRFFTAFVSEFNVAGNEVHTFEFYDEADPLAPPVVVESPDPGRALITGDPLDANTFRIPTVWGAKHTAPYFHDNSAADLEELMLHYQAYFDLVGIPMTAQDREDIIAYMQLLE
jgi:cytochrome c peroxidase